MSDHDDYIDDNDETPTPNDTDASLIPEFPKQPEIRFHLEREVTSPLEEINEKVKDNALSFIRENAERIFAVMREHEQLFTDMGVDEEALLQAAEQRGETLSSEQGSLWYRNLIAALATAVSRQQDQKATARDDSDWYQVIENESQNIRAGFPRQNLKGHRPEGEEAHRMLERAAHTGTVFDVPLWHSGLWLRLRTPNTSQLAQLQYELNQTRIDVGSDTKGLVFSNTSQTLTSVVVNFALRFVVQANVHYTTGSDLKSYIKQPDVPVLIWAMACVLYPKGIDYAHPCIADPNACQHVTHEVLNLSRLQWTDTNALSVQQKRLMGRRFQRMTDEEWTLYQGQHVLPQRKTVWVGDVGVELSIPDVQAYEEAGTAWINRLIEMTHGTMNEPPHGNNRNRYIRDLAAATTAQQYQHWVSAIVMRTDDEDATDDGILRYDDEETIQQALINIFSEENHMGPFLDGVQDFIGETMISMIAIPSFRCPNCDTPIAEAFYDRFPHLVGLDVINAFFILVNRKLS